MKKTTGLVIIILSAFLSAGAQKSDIAFATVRYTFLYVTDTTQPTDVTSENMIVYLGKNISGYKSYDRVIRDSVMKEQMAQNEANMRSGGPVQINMTATKPGSGNSLYKYSSNGKMDRVENLVGKYYVIDDKIPVINWTITQETKEIQGLACQKATAPFRGRNYTAWFCSALPYSNGPWKLGGLPGLILEASDDKNEVVFQFAGFEDVSSKNIPVGVQDNAIKATQKEFNQLQEAYTNDPQGFARSQMAGSNIKMINVVGRSGTPVKRKVNNNPIEKSAD